MPGRLGVFARHSDFADATNFIAYLIYTSHIRRDGIGGSYDPQSTQYQLQIGNRHTGTYNTYIDASSNHGRSFTIGRFDAFPWDPSMCQLKIVANAACTIRQIAPIYVGYEILMDYEENYDWDDLRVSVLQELLDQTQQILSAAHAATRAELCALRQTCRAGNGHCSPEPC